MLVHKGGQINNVQLITGLRIAEMSQRQGGYVQRMEVIVKKDKKSGGGGCQGRCEWRSEAFVIFFLGGGAGGGVGLRGGGVRVDVN